MKRTLSIDDRDPVRTHSHKKSSRPRVPNALPGRLGLLCLALTALVCAVPALAQSPQPPGAAPVDGGPVGTQAKASAAPQQSPEQQLPGTISGTVVDPSGAVLGKARVKLLRDDQSPPQELLAGEDGEFLFADVAPGPFHLTVASQGFAPQTVSGILHPGEACVVPQIALAVSSAVTEMSVVLPQVEVAEYEIKLQEKQRALGFIPNFYVSYVPDAAPLTPKQKFELAWKTSIDPITFGTIAVFAAIEQAQNTYAGYGQGGAGYGKRFGAGLADSATSTLFGGAIFPSLFKQDPRYFYKGTGTIRSRILYALANAVICKSDKKRWQFNYSGFLGAFASGGISTLYYPQRDRGAGLVFEGALVGVGAAAVTNLFQEFAARRFTPHLPKRDPASH